MTRQWESRFSQIEWRLSVSRKMRKLRASLIREYAETYLLRSLHCQIMTPSTSNNGFKIELHCKDAGAGILKFNLIDGDTTKSLNVTKQAIYLLPTSCLMVLYRLKGCPSNGLTLENHSGGNVYCPIKAVKDAVRNRKPELMHGLSSTLETPWINAVFEFESDSKLTVFHNSLPRDNVMVYEGTNLINKETDLERIANALMSRLKGRGKNASLSHPTTRDFIPSSSSSSNERVHPSDVARNNTHPSAVDYAASDPLQDASVNPKALQSFLDQTSECRAGVFFNISVSMKEWRRRHGLQTHKDVLTHLILKNRLTFVTDTSRSRPLETERYYMPYRRVAFFGETREQLKDKIRYITTPKPKKEEDVKDWRDRKDEARNLVSFIYSHILTACPLAIVCLDDLLDIIRQNSSFFEIKDHLTALGFSEGLFEAGIQNGWGEQARIGLLNDLKEQQKMKPGEAAPSIDFAVFRQDKRRNGKQPAELLEQVWCATASEEDKSIVYYEIPESDTFPELEDVSRISQLKPKMIRDSMIEFSRIVQRAVFLGREEKDPMLTEEPRRSLLEYYAQKNPVSKFASDSKVRDLFLTRVRETFCSIQYLAQTGEHGTGNHS
jgi:hypothetical protein